MSLSKLVNGFRDTRIIPTRDAVSRPFDQCQQVLLCLSQYADGRMERFALTVTHAIM